MNKKKLIKASAFKAGVSAKSQQKSVEAFLSVISDTLKDGKVVIIPDFGRFYVQKCPERQGHNPQNGEEITIPATSRVRFKPFGNITNFSMKYGL